jgi:secondary thiamine-phosphate synthase enzyme
MTTFTIRTAARSALVDITAQVQDAVREHGATGDGVATVFCPHTTAAITINENADPDVQRDWLRTLDELVPANQRHFTHAEGNSDSHLKSSLVGASEQVIVSGGKLVLGTWQAIYFAEFDGPRTRTVHVAFSQ